MADHQERRGSRLLRMIKCFPRRVWFRVLEMSNKDVIDLISSPIQLARSISYEHLLSSSPTTTKQTTIELDSEPEQEMRNVIETMKPTFENKTKLQEFPETYLPDDSFKSLPTRQTSDIETAVVKETDCPSKFDTTLSKTKIKAKASRTTRKVGLSGADMEDARRYKEAVKARKLREKIEAKQLRQVNKRRVNKRESASEMIIEMSAATSKVAVGQHLKRMIEEAKCVFNISHSLPENTFVLSRSVKARFDEDLGYWVPLEVVNVLEENHVFVLIKAKEFLQMASDSMRLQRHVEKVKSLRTSAKPVYVIEGLAAVQKRSRIQCDSDVDEDQDGQNVSKVTKQRTRNSPYNEDDVEEALLDLQVLHNCLILHSASALDSASEIFTLVLDISTIPYKKDRIIRSSLFCTDITQIATGSDNRDTFEKMLSSIQRISPGIASAISQSYSNLRHLTESLDHPEALAHVKIGQNRDGSRASRREVGKANSRIIFKALTCKDSQAEVA